MKLNTQERLLVEKIEGWIHRLNATHQPDRKSCAVFRNAFDGFYSLDTLEFSYFVIVDVIPKPEFPELREAGLGDFMDMEVEGITYDDTYYILRGHEDDLGLHFHELVHVIQWRELTLSGFIERYIDEYQKVGYKNVSLEKMAYKLEGHHREKRPCLCVEKYVRENL